jgi:hypothetical protein
VSNQRPHDAWPALFRSVQRLVNSWWQSDRIRVSPSAGRLLRLRPPCCLHVYGQYAEIVERAEPNGTLAVVYGCRTRAGSGTLMVRLDSATANAVVEWHQDGRTVRLLAEDVEVFGQCFNK